uniref:Uncharacterized protein n=1 Tax=Oryza brachyantha TaxID=4533 RepID=J3LHY7_ORYBR
MPSEASLLSGEIPHRADDDDVDGLLSLSEKSVLLDMASTTSEASLLLGETPRDGIDEMPALLSFLAKSMFFATALIPSEAVRLLGEFPLNKPDEVAGLLSFSGRSTFLDKAPLPLDADVLLGESPRDDFAACDVALDTLDTDTLGEIPGDDTAEERVLLSLSVRSILFDRALVPPDVAVLIGEIPREGIATAAGLASLPTLMLFDKSAVPFEAVGVLGELPRDEIDEETKRSILSARSILLDNVFAADDRDVFFGETPRYGIDDRAGLLILSVRSTLLDMALTDALPPIMAGQRWWSITLACGFSGCSVALLPLDGLLFLSPAAASLVLV